MDKKKFDFKSLDHEANWSKILSSPDVTELSRDEIKNMIHEIDRCTVPFPQYDANLEKANKLMQYGLQYLNYCCDSLHKRRQLIDQASAKLKVDINKLDIKYKQLSARKQSKYKEMTFYDDLENQLLGTLMAMDPESVEIYLKNKFTSIEEINSYQYNHDNDSHSHESNSNNNSSLSSISPYVKNDSHQRITDHSILSNEILLPIEDDPSVEKKSSSKIMINHPNTANSSHTNNNHKNISISHPTNKASTHIKDVYPAIVQEKFDNMKQQTLISQLSTNTTTDNVKDNRDLYVYGGRNKKEKDNNITSLYILNKTPSSTTTTMNQSTTHSNQPHNKSTTATTPAITSTKSKSTRFMDHQSINPELEMKHAYDNKVTSADDDEEGGIDSVVSHASHKNHHLHVPIYAEDKYSTTIQTTDDSIDERSYMNDNNVHKTELEKSFHKITDYDVEQDLSHTLSSTLPSTYNTTIFENTQDSHLHEHADSKSNQDHLYSHSSRSNNDRHGTNDSKDMLNTISSEVSSYISPHTNKSSISETRSHLHEQHHIHTSDTPYTNETPFTYSQSTVDVSPESSEKNSNTHSNTGYSDTVMSSTLTSQQVDKRLLTTYSTTNTDEYTQESEPFQDTILTSTQYTQQTQDSTRTPHTGHEETGTGFSVDTFHRTHDSLFEESYEDNTSLYEKIASIDRIEDHSIKDTCMSEMYERNRDDNNRYENTIDDDPDHSYTTDTSKPTYISEDTYSTSNTHNNTHDNTRMSSTRLSWNKGRASIELIETAMAVEVVVLSFNLEDESLMTVQNIRIQTEFVDEIYEEYEVYTRNNDTGTFPSHISYSAYFTGTNELSQIIQEHINRNSLDIRIHFIDQDTDSVLGTCTLDLMVMIENSCNILRQEVNIIDQETQCSIGQAMLDVRGYHYLRTCFRK